MLVRFLGNRFFIHIHNACQRGQGFALPGSGIHGKLFQIVFQKGQHHLLGSAGNASVRIAAGSTESNTESLVTAATCGKIPLWPRQAIEPRPQPVLSMAYAGAETITAAPSIKEATKVLFIGFLRFIEKISRFKNTKPHTFVYIN